MGVGSGWSALKEESSLALLANGSSRALVTVGEARDARLAGGVSIESIRANLDAGRGSSGDLKDESWRDGDLNSGSGGDWASCTASYAGGWTGATGAAFETRQASVLRAVETREASSDASVNSIDDVELNQLWRITRVAG